MAIQLGAWLTPPASDLQGGSATDSRRIDALSLMAMSDAFFARIFHVRNEVVPFGTVSLTTYFHADTAELIAEDITRLLAVADAKIFHKSFGDQNGELWSPAGRLLATTHQIAYFKAGKNRTSTIRRRCPASAPTLAWTGSNGGCSVLLGPGKRPANVDLDDGSSRVGADGLASRRAHGDKIILSDAAPQVNIAVALLAHRGLPGIDVAPGRLVVVAHERPRIRRRRQQSLDRAKQLPRVSARKIRARCRSRA